MKQAQQEVNEILSSIRKMISEEENMVSNPDAPSNSKFSSESILDLTQMVQEDGSVVQLSAVPQVSASSFSDTGPQAPPFEEQSRFTTFPESIKASMPHLSQDMSSSSASSYETTDFDHSQPLETTSSMPMPTSSSFSLGNEHPQEENQKNQTASSPEFLSHDTLQESAAAFAALAQAAQRQPTVEHSSPTTETVGHYTVDALMRDLLKPLLKEWLDAHLPSLVRALVLEQIEKVLQQKNKTGS